jgi:hypothetical protein
MVGCAVSPQPEPPSIDITRLQIGGALSVDGESGAVTPPGAVVTAVDLEDASPAASDVADASGAFALLLVGGQTDAVRLVATANGLSSDPLDVRGVIGFKQNQVEPLPVPLAGCFTLDPPDEVGPVAAAAVAVITLTNACATDATIDAMAIRSGSAAWSVSSTGPLAVPRNAQRVVTVKRAAGSAAVDDILVLTFGSPDPGLRALTLLAAP